MLTNTNYNKSIAFIANNKSFLPEIDAYSRFFHSIGWEVKIFRHKPELNDLKPFRVEWHLMGIDLIPKVPERIKIHEYCSVSTPPAARLKNRIKKLITVEPDYRVFQSEWVANELQMFDKPYIFRDMGIDKSFYISDFEKTVSREFDFVYAGSFDKHRNITNLIEVFLKNFPSQTMLLIGDIPNWLVKLNSKQLELVLSVPYMEMSNWLPRATYGINYIPNIYPFNHQTSTKLLEYCAAGLKIITTSYDWVNRFEKEKHGQFFKINRDGENFQPKTIEEFPFVTPEISSESWENKFSSVEFKKILLWLDSFVF